MATPEEVDNFDQGTIPAPSLSPFRPYWDDIHCLWNGSLADQVIDELLAAGHVFDGRSRKDVKDYFFQRLSTLRKELKRQTPGLNETSQQAMQRANTQHMITLARNRVQTHQSTASNLLLLNYGPFDGFLKQLFQSRQQICAEGLNKPDHAIWESLLRLVIVLQTDGHSSDETEDEERGIYHVRSRPWYSSQVTELLKYIDSYRETTNNYGNRHAGKAFRT